MKPQFTTFEQVEREFKNKSNGSSRISESEVRLSDLQEHKEIVEAVLGTEYNTLSGYSFREIMEAVSLSASNTSMDYINDNVRTGGVLNESFLGTTQAQTQFPTLNKGLVMYQYEKSVLPYLAHVFDLKGNRGLAYYMELVAQNTQGDGAKGDIIASPRTLAKQTTNFITTKVTNKTVETLVQGQTNYTLYLGGSQSTPISIQPQSLIITVDGIDAKLVDVSNDRDGSAVSLFNQDGKIGDAVVDLNTGEVTLVLASAPAQGGGKIRATFNRDVETVQGGITNQAVVAPQLASILLEAENFSVFTETNLHQNRLAQSIFGINWDEEVDKLLGQCYNREIANKVLSDIVANIPTKSVSNYDISSTIGNNGSGDSKYWNTAYFQAPLNLISKNISKASGLTGLNKVSSFVVNSDALPVLQMQNKFQAIDTDENFMSGMALIGTYEGTPVIQAYEPILSGAGTQQAPTGAEVVGIYKSKKQEFLTAAVVGQFILPIVRNVFDQNNLSTNRKQLIASAATKTVVPNLAAKLVVNGLVDIGLQ